MADMEDLHEEATCSVCRDYFKDPVTLDCGHNVCRACLTQCCEPGNTEISCPQCGERVPLRQFRTNQSLANVAEISKKLSLQGPKKAKGRETVCEKHQEPLKLFSKDDETLKEHKNGRKIPLGMADEDYKKQIETKMETTLEEITEMHQFPDKQEKHLQAQMQEPEKQIASKGDEQLTTFSSVESLIQEMKKKFQQPPVELLQDVRNLLQRFEEKQTSKKSVAFPPRAEMEDLRVV